MRSVTRSILTLACGIALTMVVATTGCESTEPPIAAEPEDPRVAALMELLGSEFDSNSQDELRQIFNLDPDESIWAVFRDSTDPEVAADLSPRCEIYDGATAEEHRDFLNCRDAAYADGNCNAKTVYIVELNEDGETFDIVGLQVICVEDPKF